MRQVPPRPNVCTVKHIAPRADRPQGCSQGVVHPVDAPVPPTLTGKPPGSADGDLRLILFMLCAWLLTVAVLGLASWAAMQVSALF